MAKLIFLDFDGVLHSTDAISLPYLQFRHVGTLAEILDAHQDVRLAISSNWAAVHPLEAIKDRLGSLADRVTGTTAEEAKDLRLSRYRQCETFALRAQVEQWIMLDDQVQIVFGAEAATPEMLRRVIFCDSLLGIGTPGVLERLKRWLDSY